MDRSKTTLGMLASALLTAAGGALPLGALLAAPAPALAQATDVEPYYVVVKEPNVYLRCGAGQVWYPVGKLDQGQVLRVDGHEFGWLRVSYPSGFAAIVRKGDAELDESAGTVTLLRDSRLYANNPGASVDEAWKQLLDQPLPTNTVLQHLETLHSASGEVAGYRVAAPGGAKGFVSDTLVRSATEQEVQRFLAAPPPTSADAPSSLVDRSADRAQPPVPEREAPPVDVAAAPETTPPEAPEEDAFVDQALERETPAVVRHDEGDAIPVDEPREQPVNRFPPPSVDDPRVAEPEQPVAVPSQPLQAGGQRPTTDGNERTRAVPPPASYADLNRAFEEVMRQPTEGAEYGPLISEFQRLIETLPDEPASESIRAASRGRIEALRLRADLQESMQRMSEALASADQGSQRVQESAQTLDANPVYKFVGRLASSTVYNGQRLPLLFRVQAVDSGRTIAYLTPDPDLDLTAKLNSVVGVVVKQSREDATLGLPLIDARRVDIIKAERAAP